MVAPTSCAPRRGTGLIRSKRTFLVLGLPGLLFTPLSCSDNSCDPVERPVLSISPDTIRLSPAEPVSSLFLSSGGQSGGAWQVASKPEWIGVSPESGTLAGPMQEIQVTADMEALLTPSTLGTIEIASDIGAGRSTVRATIPFTPILGLDLDTLEIPGDSQRVSFRIRNGGFPSLVWTATTSDTWLTVDPDGGTLRNRGDEVSVRVEVDRGPLSVGTAAATIGIASNDPRGIQGLPVVVGVPPDPVTTLSSSHLKYPAGVVDRSLTITNTGKGPLTWTAGSLPSWASIEPAQGGISQGESETITVTVDPAAAGPGTVSSTGTLSTNGRSDPSFVITVSDSPQLALGITGFDHRILDAEYDAVGDRIVSVSTDPSMLHVFDVDFGTTTSVALPTVPTAVAVGPEGTMAAVGHNAFVSLVDLNTMVVTTTLPVTTDVVDLVLPGNGWVYAFPRRDQHEKIRCLDLSTGTETLSQRSIYAGTLARLHPSGKFIYAADNGLSPSDFEKFDIQNGVAEYLYDSPYHGDFSFGGNVWISRDGLRLFARSGNVFRASESPELDMLYGGNLTGIGTVRWVATSTERERIYVLSESDPHTIIGFESQFLDRLGSAALMPFSTPGGPVASESRFAFVHSENSRVYVVVQADGAGGLANDWGVIVLDTGSLF